jgi:thymidylate synthase
MPISLIACVCNYKNKLAIGSNGKLLFHFREDTQFFKSITTNSLGSGVACPNIVLMGRKTYNSLPKGKLPNRINFVLTNDKELYTVLPKYTKDLDVNKVYYINLATFFSFYNENTELNIFVIGGGYIYNAFLNDSQSYNIEKLYITHVERNDGKLIKFDDCEPDIFMDHFTSEYKLNGYSEQYTNGEYKARTLYYSLASICKQEYKYLQLMERILKYGNARTDRTGTGTISLFGTSLRFDISSTIPLLTTKAIPFKMIIKELLWITQGHTDAKVLQRQGVHIWDGNTSREFLDERGLQHYPEGVLGAGYGWQLRHHGADYDVKFADVTGLDHSQIGGFDQLQYVEDLLKNDPFSRRIMFSYWNPSDFHKTALVPCHTHCQFYVTESEGKRYLSCQYGMRSSDFFLAGDYNLVFYSVLTYILAKRHNMLPKEIIYTCGDCHIYSNHVEQVKEQLKRTSRPFPKLKLDDSIITKDWSKMTVEDFDLIGYFPHSKISAPMAV